MLCARRRWPPEAARARSRRRAADASRRMRLRAAAAVSAALVSPADAALPAVPMPWLAGSAMAAWAAGPAVAWVAWVTVAVAVAVTAARKTFSKIEIVSLFRHGLRGAARPCG